MSILNTTLIPTLKGNVKAQNVKIGDYLTGSTGKQVQVTNVIQTREITFHVTLNDGMAFVFSGTQVVPHGGNEPTIASLDAMLGFVNMEQGNGLICNATAALAYTPEVMGKLITHGTGIDSSAKLEPIYLLGNEAQRIALYKSITDQSTITERSVFTTYSYTLSNQLATLARSLGIFAWYSSRLVDNHRNYAVYLEPKAVRRITSVNPAGMNDTTCITVDAPDGHYAI